MTGITRDMKLSEIMEKEPDVIPLLMDVGMGCIYCPASLEETLEEAAWVHCIDIDDLMEYIENA